MVIDFGYGETVYMDEQEARIEDFKGTIRHIFKGGFSFF
jgi:hypothetical protein